MYRLSTLLVLFTVVLAGCMSKEERQDIALLTCSIMGETRPIDSVYRIQLINEARQRIGEPLYVNGDARILESFTWGLCPQLVLNDPTYDTTLNELQKIEAEERRQNLERMERENEERRQQERAREQERREQQQQRVEEQQTRWSQFEETALDRSLSGIFKFQCGDDTRPTVRLRLPEELFTARGWHTITGRVSLDFRDNLVFPVERPQGGGDAPSVTIERPDFTGYSSIEGIGDKCLLVDFAFPRR